jgi:lysophospholipase L1-like esterase
MITQSRIKKTLKALIVLILSAFGAQAQPFYKDIQAYKKEDSIQKPPKKAIIFTGSSSFRMWSDVQQNFPDYKIVNRAFGGSTIPDVIRYANDIIIPYKPKQVVIYCGDNDMASGDNINGDSVANRFITLFNILRKELPRTSIVFVSIKPSPSRAHLMPKIEDANRQISEFIKKKKRAAFVDVYHKMLNPDGTPVKTLFREDMLHMNAQGYAIWKDAIQPYLKK